MTLHVWWASLTAADQSLTAVLDSRERARVESLRRPADQGRSLVGAALLRFAVADHLGAAPQEIVIDRTCAECGGPHGAPRVLGPGAPPFPRVSVSHSGLLVLVALSDHGPVGVDVQRLADLPDPAGGPGWVRREALVKAGGAVRDAATQDLRPPLDGYAAAVVAPDDLPGPITEHAWPPAG
ncbi:4'-phosphopantetheinyl transferase family protein [Myceligenerans halotolerans]